MYYKFEYNHVLIASLILLNIPKTPINPILGSYQEVLDLPGKQFPGLYFQKGMKQGILQHQTRRVLFSAARDNLQVEIVKRGPGRILGRSPA